MPAGRTEISQISIPILYSSSQPPALSSRVAKRPRDLLFARSVFPRCARFNIEKCPSDPGFRVARAPMRAASRLLSTPSRDHRERFNSDGNTLASGRAARNRADKCPYVIPLPDVAQGTSPAESRVISTPPLRLRPRRVLPTPRRGRGICLSSRSGNTPCVPTFPTVDPEGEMLYSNL